MSRVSTGRKAGRHYELSQKIMASVNNVGSGELILTGKSNEVKVDRQERPTFVCPATGSQYTGQWVGDEKDGKGKQIWSDNSWYEGDWRHNVPHGDGKFVRADGTILEGQWQRGKLHGYGTYQQAAGTINT